MNGLKGFWLLCVTIIYTYVPPHTPVKCHQHNKDTNEEREMSLEGHAKKKRLYASSCRHNTTALRCPVAYSTEVVKYVELQ